MSDKVKQLEEWTGEFGDEYTERNKPDEKNINQRMAFWSSIFSTLNITLHNKPKDILEVGANSGANLIAIDNIYKLHNEYIGLSAIEPNLKAKNILKQQDIRTLKIVNGNACNIGAETSSYDIVFTCGVLIHIHPDDLYKAMREIHRVSKRYIICAEYFSPEPREIKYRDRDGLLFTMDFGSEWLDKFPGLRCLVYSFSWKRITGMDNLTWWVFEKVN